MIPTKKEKKKPRPNPSFITGRVSCAAAQHNKNTTVQNYLLFWECVIMIHPCCMFMDVCFVLFLFLSFLGFVDPT